VSQGKEKMNERTRSEAETHDRGGFDDP
jgi:hypothetical protein